MRLRLRPVLAFFFVLVGGCVFVGGEKTQPGPERRQSLAQVYAGKFPVGAAVEPWQLETAEGRLLAWHFNSVVAENVMKPQSLQPVEGRFDFAAADRIVDFAARQGMKVRGHTLLWHEQTPDWFWQGADGTPASRALVLERLQQHIRTVVGRYRERVYAWDVVNEVIDPSQKNCLRADNWFKYVGADYIDWAFRYAHESDPSARMFINDYDTTEPLKRECLLRIVKGLLDRGVPVHGIGHQMHINIENPSAQQVDDTLAQCARLGLENQITEMDMSFYTPSLSRLPGSEADLLARQRARFEELFNVFLAHPDVTAVTFWGISDAHTWLNARQSSVTGDKPLLFDAEQQPKPAYWGVVNAASKRKAALRPEHSHF